MIPIGDSVPTRSWPLVTWTLNIVHTPGGLVLAAGQIAHALKGHRASS